jgi:hypothetical protein
MLNQPEVKITGKAPGMEWELSHINANHWRMIITATNPKTNQRSDTIEVKLTNIEAQCTIALFIGEATDDENLNQLLYSWAEPVWEYTPTYLRPIP